MSASLCVTAFWTGLIFIFVGYILRKKPISKIFYQIGATVFFIGFLLFAWWGIIRMVQFR